VKFAGLLDFSRPDASMLLVGVETDLIIAVVSSGAAVSALFTSVAAWLSSRRERPDVKITVGGKSVEINLDDPEQAEKFLKDYLARRAPDEQGTVG
jgi:hypothetical protein